MIRFIVLLAVAGLALVIAMGSSIFGGVALLAVCVTGFGLIVALYADIMRES
ncbi:MAG TPA: hypothetical protein VJ019_02675 [Aestuariivirga sp.]|jgi:hypothetical protein|nr:hypothetical protein [Aestuariivirga sp.]